MRERVLRKIPKNVRDDFLGHFLGRVERGVAVALKGQQGPLILAGVDYLVSIYRNVNAYAHLAAETIGGSPDQLPLNELFAAAWTIVGQDLLKHQQRAFAVCREHAPSDERWGSFISPTTVHAHRVAEPGCCSDNP